MADTLTPGRPRPRPLRRAHRCRSPLTSPTAAGSVLPTPTPEQFQQYVAEGKIHYFIAGTMMQGETGSDDAARIATWVEANFTSTHLGGATVYRLAD